MSSADVKRVVYRGPAQQVCYPLSEHGYSATLVPEKVYELPTDLADRLLSSSVHFQVARPSGFSFTKPVAGDSAYATSSEQENQ